jgi:hypothetical protein
MKTIIDLMTVNYAEYSYFKKLAKNEQVSFFMELYEAASHRYSDSGLDLGKFFATLKEQILESKELNINLSELPKDKGTDYIDVMIDDENLMVESNSLKAVRHIIYKFIESGYILQRDKNMEKTFKRDKITRYMRIFKIIDQIPCICIN